MQEQVRGVDGEPGERRVQLQPGLVARRPDRCRLPLDQRPGRVEVDEVEAVLDQLEADTAATGAALLAAVAVGLAPQAQASISALVGKARTVRPTAWWTEVADTRAAWFEQVRHEPAVHDWRSR